MATSKTTTQEGDSMNREHEHYNALVFRLANERVRLIKSKTEREKEMRTVFVQGVEKEIAGELRFLESIGVELPAGNHSDLLDAILLDELFS
jgi:hypothetical protein